MRLLFVLAVVLAALVAATPWGMAAERIRSAHFGKAIALRGFDGERVRVRPYRLAQVDGGEFDTPAEGSFYVGVWLSLKNVGRKDYMGGPSGGASLVTSGGRTLDTTFVSGGPCESPDAARVRVPRGQTRRLCVAFEVPETARLRYFEFNLRSGFADESGQWRRLPSPA